ncbi:MAG: DegV family protein [Gemmatimonadetes bacterium]|nr:DegV family protein [Gemmatimonadota bacterium]
MSVALVTDSTAEIRSLAPRSEWAVVPLEVEIDGERYREGPELSAGDFHHLLQRINSVPATLPPAPEAFLETYRRLLASHDEVLSIHISGELSRTVDHAREAAASLGATERIRVVDSRLAGAPVGLLCLEAEARLGEGSAVDAVVGDLARIPEAAAVYFSVYTLDFLYLGGRLGRAPGAGPTGSHEDRPILTMRDGGLALVERVAGDTTRVERIAEMLSERFGTDSLVAVCVHAGSRGEDAARMLERRVASRRGGEATVWRRAPLGPVLCAHTGFDVCGVAAWPRALSRLPA